MAGYQESTHRERFGADLAPDVLLPAQFASRTSPTPERRLMVAVLTEAVRTHQRSARRCRRCGRPILIEVDEWFASDDTSWPFSFVSICDRLGIDPQYFRSRMADWSRPVAGECVARCERRISRDVPARAPSSSARVARAS